MSDERDGFDVQLARTLARTGAVPADACPDAELLAAWIDGSLDDEQRRACTIHAASCLRCQSVAALADSSDSPSGVMPGTVVERAPTPARVLPFRWRRLLWTAAPLSAAASLVLTVWIARSAREVDPISRETRVGSERTDAPVAESRAPGPSVNAPPSPRAGEAQPPPLGQSRRAEPERQAKEDVARERSKPSNDKITATPETTSDMASAHMRGAAPEMPRAPAPAAPAAAARDEVKQELPKPMAGPAPPPVQSVPAEEMASASDRRDQAIASARSRAFAPPPLFAAPSGRVAWRLEPQGRIVRAPRQQPEEEAAVTGDDLVTGVALSDEIAWVVGRKGAIWRTTDGLAWNRVSAPSAENFVRVHAQGPGAATVVTDTGRTYVTTDGGRTWTLQR
jgi:hypothetical protein